MGGTPEVQQDLGYGGGNSASVSEGVDTEHSERERGSKRAFGGAF